MTEHLSTALWEASMLLIERTLPDEGMAQSTEIGGLNLMLIVAGAVGISVLARWLSARGNRK